jgi:hypothetical protein
MKRTSSWLLASLFASIGTLSTVPAHAEPLDASRSEAADRFDRGLQLVDAGDLSGGLAEFQRAYGLIPSSIALYNIGLVYAALHRPVETARTLEKALANPEGLKPENVVRAREVLHQQEDKIGRVELSTNVKEGVVEVDNVEASKLPLERPLDVASGPHVIGVVSAGYAPSRHEVIVIGHEQISVHLDLVAIEGILAHIALHGHVPAADVLIDGERIGKTPLESTITVSPGSHTVEVRRAGYAPAERSITLQDGSHADLSLDPVVDRSALGREGGWLALKTSETQSVLSVDGTEAGVVLGSVQLPAGPHRIRLERGGFLSAERDVDVPLGGTRTVSVVFEPTPETRVQYVSATVKRRAWSWATVGLGAAMATGGAILAVVEQNQLPGAQSALTTANHLILTNGEGGTPQPCNPSGTPGHPQSAATLAACNATVTHDQSTVNNLQTGRTVGWVAVGVGGVTLVTGVVLVLTADNPHKYDEKPVDRSLAGWHVVPEIGLGGASVVASRSF